jgi:N-acetylglucosamine kinase-like BadF-type ATPase
MILIADSGSTKTSWCLADAHQPEIRFETEGYNPCYEGADKLSSILRPKLPNGFDCRSVSHVAFYGAGVYDDKHSVIEAAILPLFPLAKVDAEMDLVGSARALLANRSGFAAILGTGANSCLWSGTQVTHNVDSLGFLLGDEGSGGYMGKRIIGDFIRGLMPAQVQQCFSDTYRLSNDQLIQNIYASTMPNRYCAAFTKFLTGAGADFPYCTSVVRDAFRDFFRNIVCHYPDYQRYSFSCVGTIGYLFGERLAEVAKEFGMEMGTILKEPMDGLLKYHLNSE